MRRLRALPSIASAGCGGVAFALVLALAGASCRGNTDHAAPPPAAEPGPAPLPGAEPFAPALAARMQEALRQRSACGPARGLPDDPDRAPRYTNRLILEPSLYLQMHAKNPVDWHPWGPEAFAAATRLGRPVLLSVGYASCHWCHLMSDESFDDPEIAEYINRHYIAIKVDREERPDVDDLYLSAVQIVSGHGAWPTTVWLTAEGAPFFGGTYFPPRARDGTPGLLALLQRQAHEYEHDPEGVARSAEQLLDAVRRILDPGAPVAFSRQDAVAVMDSAAGAFETHFDQENGGVRGAPKHPATLPVRVLLRHHRRTGEDVFLRMATRTLEAMAAGGIHDQVGGGFHHYAADERWQVPHFEKLLFDNALLVVTYLEAYQVTGREDFARVARDVLRFLERELRGPGGVFYAALDADSPSQAGASEQGAFYTWHPSDMDRALAPPRAALARAYFGVGGAGSVTGLGHDQHVLFRARPLAEVAAALGMAEDRARAMLPGIREALYRVRGRRARPVRDDKILSDWNALMISAQARAALVLGEPSYLQGAIRTAGVLLGALRRDGRLHHVLEAGRGRIPAYLTDYAMLVAALLDLFEATGDPAWLREAMALDRRMHEQLADRARGGYFFTSEQHGALLVREKPNYDGTLPSGSSVAALSLLRLHAITGQREYLDRAEALFASVAPVVLDDPARMSDLLLALDFWTDEAKQIVIATPGPGGPPARVEAWPLLEVLGRRFVPNAVVIPAASDQHGDLAALAPVVQGKVAEEATAYVCEHGRCEPPTRDPAVFAGQVSRVAPLP